VWVCVGVWGGGGVVEFVEWCLGAAVGYVFFLNLHFQPIEYFVIL